MKQLLFVVWSVCISAVMVCNQGIAEEYVSDGFCAKIGKNGVLYSVTYGGKEIFSRCQLEGSYELESNPDKIDTRFFQASDRNGKAEITQKGETMTVRTISTLGNKQYEKGAEYEICIVLTPHEITFNAHVTTKTDMQTYMGLFRYDFEIPVTSVVGCQVQSKSSSRPDIIGLIPIEYQKKFSIKNGGSINFTLPYGLFTIAASNDKSYIGLLDCRAWNDNKILIVSECIAKWSTSLQTIEKGTVFAWGTKVSVQLENK